VVLHPPPDRQVGDDLDAQGREVCRRSHAGAQQDSGAAVAPGGQEYLVCAVLGAVRGDDAHGRRAGEEHAVDGDAAMDGEVRPGPDLGRQVGHGRALPDAVHDGDGMPVGAVEVVHPPESVRDGRVDEAEQRGGQLGVGALPYGERAGPAVVGAVAGGRVLQ